MDTLKKSRSGVVAIIGPTNAGKSTLLNCILHRKVSIVSSKAQTTRRQVLGIKDSENGQIAFVDTPGIIHRQKRNKLSRQIDLNRGEAESDADCLLLVLDAKESLRYFKGGKDFFLDEFNKEIPKLHTNTVCALNKADLLSVQEMLFLLEKLNEFFMLICKREISCVPVSALTAERVPYLTDLLLSMMPEGPKLYPDGREAEDDRRTFALEIIREKLYQQLNKEIPYNLGVRLERWLPEKRNESGSERDTVRIMASILVRRDSQKAIVIGKNGTKIKSIGIAARKEIQRHIGKGVYLDLFVKVDPKWIEAA